MKKINQKLLLIVCLISTSTFAQNYEIEIPKSTVPFEKFVENKIQAEDMQLKNLTTEKYEINQLEEQSFNQAPINMFLYAIQLKMQTTLANKNIDKKAQVLICGDTVFLYESNEIEKINESLKNGVLKKCKIPNAYE